MQERATLEIDDNKFKPDVDSTIQQGDDSDIEVSFVEDDAVETAVESREPAPERRAQNDPGERHDPSEYQSQQWAEREAQFAEREERYAKALADAEKRRVETERESAKVAIDGIDLRIKTTVEAIKAAKTEGDVSAEVDFTQQLAELRGVRGQIVSMQGQLPTAEQIDRQLDEWKASERAKRPAAGSSQPVGAAPGNELATRYMQHNTWMSDPAQAQARLYLLETDKRLAQEGFDPKSPQHFDELSRRVAARFPSVSVKMLDGRAIGTGATLAPSRSQSPPVASARSTIAPVNGVTTAKSKTAVQLTSMDRQMMRAMGLDASDKRVQAKYAREKLARLQSERR